MPDTLARSSGPAQQSPYPVLGTSFSPSCSRSLAVMAEKTITPGRRYCSLQTAVRATCYPQALVPNPYKVTASWEKQHTPNDDFRPSGLCPPKKDSDYHHAREKQQLMQDLGSSFGSLVPHPVKIANAIAPYKKSRLALGFGSITSISDSIPTKAATSLHWGKDFGSQLAPSLAHQAPALL